MRSEQDEIVWANVERLRKEKIWEYKELADAMGISPQAVYSLSRNGIGKASIKKLANALGVEPRELLRFDTPMREKVTHQSANEITTSLLLAEYKSRMDRMDMRLEKAEKRMVERVEQVEARDRNRDLRIENIRDEIAAMRKEIEGFRKLVKADLVEMSTKQSIIDKAQSDLTSDNAQRLTKIEGDLRDHLNARTHKPMERIRQAG